MINVQTVTGDVPVAALGSVLMHEHLVSSAPGIAENYPELYIEGYHELVMRDLTAMKENGITTVVDATPYDLGRDVKALKRLSAESGVNIICCTGSFLRLPAVFGYYTPAQIAALFIKDITKGVADTGIKAGIIKVAMDTEGPTEDRVLIHKAAAIASNETGMPIMMHSAPQKEMGRHQLRILQEEHVNMARVKVDHCLETTDIDYLCWLADQGCWLGVDRLPLIVEEGDYAVSTQSRIKVIKALIDAGLQDRMLFSHDFISASTYHNHMPTEERQLYIDNLNPERFLFLKNVAFPALERMGIDRDLLERMCVDNPRNYFAGC